MRRARMKPRKDRRVFRHTANKVHEMNLKPIVMRGGIRL